MTIGRHLVLKVLVLKVLNRADSQPLLVLWVDMEEQMLTLLIKLVSQFCLVKLVCGGRIYNYHPEILVFLWLKL